MMMNLRFLLALALFVSLSAVVSADEAAAEIDCAKDCADFVATVVKNEKATLVGELAKCNKANDGLKKEHDDTVASLKQELTQLQEHTKKSAELEKELRALNTEIEAKYKGETEQQKEMIKKASELAKQSQQEVIEAKMEIANLVESMSSTRINFKLIKDDIVRVWRKLVEKFKGEAVETESDL